jgi:two-component system, OmpR family, sensor histidine kinase KdpD
VKPVEASVRIRGVWEPGWCLFSTDNVHRRFRLPHLGLGLLRQGGFLAAETRKNGAMKDDDRKDPEAFLGLEPELKNGTLKVYIGGSAGVGKTYRMLEEAHRLRAQGRDVVIGFVETHGRAETAAMIGDLEIVPPRNVNYQGTSLSEMDVDAILQRKPEFAVVDELPHTNAPGSRHRKRYQDVEELVATGINVISAMNVQHLESLKQVVKRITGVDVGETVPDTFLLRADQVVTVDIPIEELRQRLREGKIYPPERVESALKNFFKPSNLAALRELALREVADDQSRHREELERLKRDGGARPPVTERLMVCLSLDPSTSQELLRKAARAAARLNADWYAVHVDTPSESLKKISTKDFRALLDNINLAGDLGAEVAWLEGEDAVKVLLEFAYEKHISRIIIGRAKPTFWNRLFRRSVTDRIVAAAHDFEVEIVNYEPRIKQNL